MMRNLLVTALLFTGYISSGQKILTLEEAVATALQNNYDIRISRNDSIVAALDYSFRYGAFLPQLNATAGTVWNNNNQKQTLADGTKRKQNGIKSNNLTSSLNLNWKLFDGLKMFATLEKAGEFIKLGELTIKNQVVNSVAAVINNYYNIAAQKQQLKAIQEVMSVSEERVRLAQNRLDIGVGIKPDVLQSKVDLNAQRANILTQETLIGQLKEQLNQAMNVALNTQYDVQDSIPINHNLGLGEIQNDIENTNPFLQIAQKSIDISRITLKERKADQFPILSFNSAYNFSRTNNKAVINNFSLLFNQNQGFNYGFSLAVPILNNFNTRRLIRQAKQDITYQQLLYDNQRSLLHLDVINAFIAYEQQKKALTLEEENILLAKENVSIIVQTLRLGASTIIQLREAQQSLENAYNRLITARYNTKLAETELRRLKGDLVR
ncbi:MAG: TolC family protein [Chitinophagaceae bacterium]|nr:TolC family protein [Chitinophagaceae bacterium]